MKMNSKKMLNIKLLDVLPELSPAAQKEIGAAVNRLNDTNGQERPEQKKVDLPAWEHDAIEAAGCVTERLPLATLHRVKEHMEKIGHENPDLQDINFYAGAFIRDRLTGLLQSDTFSDSFYPDLVQALNPTQDDDMSCTIDELARHFYLAGFCAGAAVMNELP